MSKEENQNINTFNFLTIHILSKLYQNFPVPIEINPIDEVVEIIEGSSASSDGHKNLHFYSDVITWLEQEGFLTYHEFRENVSGNLRFEQTRLTLQGLTVLGNCPSSLGTNQGKSFFEESQLVLKQGIKDAATAKVSEIVKALFTMALNHDF